MLETVAVKYYKQGYNCAESIILAGNEFYQLNLDPTVSAAFAVYGGGCGCGDVCGAIIGAMAVASRYFVKGKAHDDKAFVRKIGVTLMRNMEAKFGARKCMNIKPVLHNPDPDIKCVNTVTAAAEVLEATIRQLQEEKEAA